MARPAALPPVGRALPARCRHSRPVGPRSAVRRAVRRVRLLGTATGRPHCSHQHVCLRAVCACLPRGKRYCLCDNTAAQRNNNRGTWVIVLHWCVHDERQQHARFKRVRRYEDDKDEGEWFLYTGSGGRDLSGNKRTNKARRLRQPYLHHVAHTCISWLVVFPGCSSAIVCSAVWSKPGGLAQTLIVLLMLIVGPDVNP